MKSKVLFENRNIRCRIVITHESGNPEPLNPVHPVEYDEHHDFYKVSDLVNYCNEHHIKVPIGDCTIVESLD